MKSHSRWGPRPSPEPSSPCVTIYFNPEASYPGPLVTPPVPYKLTDPSYHVSRIQKDAMAGMIQAHGPWGLLCHLTFNRDILEKTAHHHFMRWIRAMNEEIYGLDFRQRRVGVSFARATEHQQNGRIHYHVLISEEARRIRRLTYKDYWEYGIPVVRKYVPPADLPADNVYAGKVFSEISTTGGNGFARIYPFDARRAGKAERYLVKYMTKERDVFLYRPLGHPDRTKSS